MLVGFPLPVTTDLALRGSVDPSLSTEAARSCESPAGGEVDSSDFCTVLLDVIVYIHVIHISMRMTCYIQDKLRLRLL